MTGVQTCALPIWSRDSAVEEGLRRQVETMLGALGRADEVLERIESAMALVPPDSAPAALKREVEFARQLIAALAAHR